MRKIVSNDSFFCFRSASSQTVSFYNKDERGDLQRVTFDTDQVKRIFHGSFHKVKKSFVCAGLMPKDSQTLETEVTAWNRRHASCRKMLRQQTKHSTGMLKAENVSSVQHFPERLKPVCIFWVSTYLSWREWSRRSNVSLMVELLNIFLVLGAWHINRIAPLCSRWTSWGHTDTADAWDSKCVVYYSRSTSHATTDVFLRREEGSDKQMVLQVVKRRMQTGAGFYFYWLHSARMHWRRQPAASSGCYKRINRQTDWCWIGLV